MRLFALMIASTLTFACGESAPSDKGAEENPLTDGKDDSFFQPTEHGELRMATANPAKITEDEKFHAWTFSLAGDATVDLHTEVSPNLDTVMYLYRRTSPSDSWGRYIDKNDDDGSNISSRIKLEGGEGEYRVIVKGFKSALRGTFELHGECAGTGCVASTDTCNADEFESLPTSTPWTANCATDLVGVLAGAPLSSSSGYVGLSDKCVLRGIERTAIDYYHEFWEGIAGFDDLFRYDPDEDVFLNFVTKKYADGTVVTVDAGGDEDGLSMYFDGDDRLIAAYQHSQSPTVDFFCGASNAAPIPGPDEQCFAEITRAIPREEETAPRFDELEIWEFETEHPSLAVAVARFAAQKQLDDDTEMVVTTRVMWTSTEGTEVATVEVIGPGRISREYTLLNLRDGWTVRLESDAESMNVVCD